MQTDRKSNAIDPANTYKMLTKLCLSSANSNLWDNVHEHHVIPITPNMCYCVPERNKGSRLRPLP